METAFDILKDIRQMTEAQDYLVEKATKTGWTTDMEDSMLKLQARIDDLRYDLTKTKSFLL